jgi:glycosyltransferase involved in cell wall biosynthesis
VVRVLMLTKGLGRGGTERLLHGTVRHLDRARYQVEVAYLLPWKDAFVSDIESEGVPVHCLDGTRATSVAWLPRLRRLVRTRDIDIVHTHNPAPAAAARLALPGRRPAFVHTEHNLWGRYRPVTRWANRATYRRNAAVIAVSAGVAGSITAPRPVEVVTVTHGIDLDAAHRGPDARKRARRTLETLGLDPVAPVVGTVGNFTAKKDQAILLEAAARLRSEVPDLRLVLVGTGPLETELRDLAGRLGLASAAVFAGSRPDVLELLAGFDVFALSSRFEGLPIALLEAMASGVACVATSVGGVPEVITDGEDGLLVEPGDPDALAADIGKLLADDVRRAELGDRGAHRAEAFRLTDAVRRIEAVYERVVARS